MKIKIKTKTNIKEEINIKEEDKHDTARCCA